MSINLDIDEKKQERKDKIISLVRDENFPPLKRGEMRSVMNVLPEEKNEFDSLIDELISEGKLVETKKAKLWTAKNLVFLQENFWAIKRLWLCSP